MSDYSTHAIRIKWQKFFTNHHHQEHQSSSLIPQNDDTLLLVNAGMVPFKEYFKMAETPFDKPLFSIQKCIRAGGKHNDIDNVGYSDRHHSFFEMLGNFSFGHYDHHHALWLAYEFLTKELNFNANDLFFTYHPDDCDKIPSLLRAITQLTDDHYIADLDNIWSAGDIGPQGKCCEIYVKTATGQLLEIWNIVFIDQDKDLSGQISKLPLLGIDTGAGLERLACIKQGFTSNYDNDIFSYLRTQIINKSLINDEVTIRVLSDHLRAAVFLIADGIIPGATGRGYVLRKLLRRSLNFLYNQNQLNFKISSIVADVIDIMHDQYPELGDTLTLSTSLIETEQQEFIKKISSSQLIIENFLENQTSNLIDGQTIFYLYDTKGIPLKIIEDIAKNKSLKLDLESFNKLLADKKITSKKFNDDHHSFKFSNDPNAIVTEFKGYQDLNITTQIIKLYNHTKNETMVLHNEEGYIVLKHTPFYPESGGQNGDIGYISNFEAKAEVIDTCYGDNHTIYHRAIVSGSLKTNQEVTAIINLSHRLESAKHHTATHLMLPAVSKVLGEIKIISSEVKYNKARIDFISTQKTNPTLEQLTQIEQAMFDYINAGLNCRIINTDINTAKMQGVKFLENKTYSDKVRVLQIMDEGNSFTSQEACCGTHVTNTKDIGFFVITEAKSRRLEYKVGISALNQAQAWITNYKKARTTLSDNDINLAITKVLTKNLQLIKDLQQTTIELIKTVTALMITQQPFNSLLYEVKLTLTISESKNLLSLIDRSFNEWLTQSKFNKDHNIAIFYDISLQQSSNYILVVNHQKINIELLSSYCNDVWKIIAVKQVSHGNTYLIMINYLNNNNHSHKLLLSNKAKLIDIIKNCLT